MIHSARFALTMCLVSLVVTFSALPLCGQTIIHVPADQPSIFEAIGVANNGDTILVSPGTYFESISFQGKNLTVQSTDGAAVTIIDGLNSFTPVLFTNGEGPGAVLRGFTITHGFGLPEGGGISIANASPTIEDNIITANQSCGGAGISANTSSAIIRRNVISNNASTTCIPASGGAGIKIVGAGSVQLLNNTITGNQEFNGGTGGGVMTDVGAIPLISGNLIQGNSATGPGGGIAVGISSAQITDNLISGNSSSQGGGIYALLNQAQPSFVNNTVVGNSAVQGTQVYIDGSDATAEIANNLLIDFTGTGAVYCGSSDGQVPTFDHNDVLSLQSPAGGQVPPYGGVCSDVTGINGNLQTDPQFVDTVNGNYHLQGTSPALDVGNNSAPNLPVTDLEGSPRVAASSETTCSGIVDMGAYELLAVTTGSAFLSTTSLDFGLVSIGASPIAQPVTLFASGGCVQVTSIQTTGDFQQTNNCSAMFGGGSCTIQVGFNPTAPGLRTGSLAVNLGPSTAPLTATLSGQAQNSGSVSPTSLNFGSQLLQTSSNIQSITVFSNPFLGAMQVNAVSITGDFSQSNTCSTLPAVDICTVNVTFTPTAAGERTGTLTIKTTEGLYTVPLSGSGAIPVPSLAPASLIFASQVVASSSPAQTVTLTNAGAADLQINGFRATPEFFAQSLTCPGTLILAPGSSCTFSVSFLPSSTGAKSGFFAVDTNGGTATVALSGEGTPPIATLLPQALTFDAQPIGTVSAAQTVTMTNISGGPVQLTQISAANNFLATSGCPPVLDANASCTIDVVFLPNTTGPYTGLLTVATSLGNVSAVLSGKDGHQTIHVPADIPTITAAISAAQNGDTILVSPGTYFEQVNFQGKAITVAGISGAGATILDGQNSFIPVVMSQNEPQQAVLKGFTITHGAGSGVLLLNSSPTIEDNVITNNSGCGGTGGVGIQASTSAAIIRHNVISNNDGCNLTSPGGGILVSGAVATSSQDPSVRTQILDNVITGNQGLQGNGAGIAVVFSGNAILEGNTIENNSTSGNGGGIFITDFSIVDAVQNLVANNSASVGGGIYALNPGGSSSLMLNNTVANNTAGSASALFIDGFEAVTFANDLLIDSTGVGAVTCGPSAGVTPFFSNSDVFSQGGNAYVGCADPTGISGNIKQDPLFTGAANGDYHLQASSPAIDTGLILTGSMPDQDLDGKVRVGPGNATTCLPWVDMGAYEFGLTSSGTVTLPSVVDLGTASVGGGSSTTSIFAPVQGCVQLASVKTTGDFQPTNFCGSAIGSASSCAINVTFSPTATGARTGTLTLDFGSSSPAQTINLTGNGVEQPLSASPASLSFSDQVVQNTSAAQGVTIFASFAGPLVVNGIWISGDFAQTNTCIPSVAGPSCTFSVVFTPTATGLRTGVLTVSTNQGVAVISLSGNGLASAAASLTPASLVFPDQGLNTTSAAQFATLTNTGTTSFLPGAISISGDFSVDASQCQVSLSPGASCSYSFRFKPTATGTRTGLFTVQTAVGTLSVSLSGNGVVPQASVSPQSLVFANQVVLTTSGAQAVTLLNPGTVDLSLGGISVTGSFAQTNACTATLAPGASCIISVTFTPTIVGSFSGALGIVTNGGNFLLPLSGNGVSALAGIAPSALAFGSQVLNTTSRPQTLTLTAGINALQITSITASGDFGQTNACGASLASGATCSIQVTFTPTVEGQLAGTLTVNSNEGSLTVELSGTGLARAQNTIYVPADQPTIQAAISAALNGESVQVLPGTYFEHIDFLGKAITVASTDGPSVTTIDGSTTGTVVTFQTAEGPASTLSGFTITHGTSTFEGSGIFISSASPTIQNNVITANQGCQGIGIGIGFGSPIIQNNTITSNVQVTCSGGNGGGISSRGGSPQILNNTIRGNQLLLGGEGGGIALNGASATISGNTIQHNSVFNNGGGISSFNASTPNIIQNLITDNSANSNGGGIYWSVPSGSRGPLLVNNTVANNTAASGSAAFSDGFAANVEVSGNIFIGQAGSAALNCSGLFSATPPILISNDAFSSGVSGYAGTCANAAGTSGNISLDPQFVDPAINDYHLQATSPAIDAGSNSAPDLPAVDLDGNPRIAFGNASTCSSTVDQGAFEFALTTVPAATLSPASFDFGIQPDGTTSAAATFTVNATQGCVPVTSVTTTGDFTQTNNCSSVLATGASCAVQVSFTPSLTGPRAGTLSVAANGTALTSNLSGEGGAATATVTPASLDFGSQRVGSTSAAQTVTLTNTGNLPLDISGISNSGDFAQTNACGTSLAPGAACVISITFTPTTRLTRTGSLVIQSNSNQQPTSVALAGTGVAPVAVLTASLSFAPQVVGTTTIQSATLANNGDAALDITSILASGDYAQTNSCPASLAGGSSCTIQVSFTPTAVGARNGTVTVSDDDPVNGQQILSLTGTGLDYSVSASPASATIKVGQTASYTVSVTALGGSVPNTVSLGCSGLPAGASCGFSPATVAPGAGTASSLLSLATGSGSHGTTKTPRGTYNVTIVATSGALNHTTTVQLIVQ